VDPKYTAGLVPASAERLSPAAVRTVLFRWARLGHRGFDADDVREFCRRVEDELIMLLKERVALQGEVGQLRLPVLGAQADQDGADFGDGGYGGAGRGAGGYGATGYSGADAQARTVRILAQAQQTAERYIGEAQEYCRRLAQDARRQRDETLAAAQLDAALVREEAHEQGSRTRRAAIAVQHPAQR
jgi:cell division septum initiation protein DivIVA